MTTQDRKDATRRKKSLKVTRLALLAALDNSDGLKRLAGLTDEEWKAAEEKDSQTAESDKGGTNE